MIRTQFLLAIHSKTQVFNLLLSYYVCFHVVFHFITCPYSFDAHIPLAPSHCIPFGSTGNIGALLTVPPAPTLTGRKTHRHGTADLQCPFVVGSRSSRLGSEGGIVVLRRDALGLVTSFPGVQFWEFPWFWGSFRWNFARFWALLYI